MMCKALISCALLFLSAHTPVASPALTQGTSPARDKDTASLPFDPSNNLVVINASLNGRGPFRFLLDTGATHHVLKPEVVRTLGLKLEGSGEIDGGGRGNVSATLARVAEVRVGAFTLEGQQFFVTPFPASYPFDGFLGAELFKRLTVGIDFRRSLVTLTRPGGFRYRGAGVSLPLKLYGGLIPQVEAEVGGAAGEGHLERPEVEAGHRRRPYDLQVGRHLPERAREEPAQVQRRRAVGGRRRPSLAPPLASASDQSVSTLNVWKTWVAAS